jgi:vesicle coat complex subunit
VLHGVSKPIEDLALFEHCLDDPDMRIRELALMRLRKIEQSHLKPLMPKIRAMVNDPGARVRQAATRLTHHIDSISLAHEGEKIP